MNKLLGLNIELHIDCSGKLRITTKGDIGDIYMVVGFKVKNYKGKEFIFPLLKVEMPKK